MFYIELVDYNPDLPHAGRTLYHYATAAVATTVNKNKVFSY